MAQLWGGRFTKETDQLVYNFNASISFDKKLYAQDIKGSIAHVMMLAKQGILTDIEKKQIKILKLCPQFLIRKSFQPFILYHSPAVYYIKFIVTIQENNKVEKSTKTKIVLYYPVIKYKKTGNFYFVLK